MSAGGCVISGAGAVSALGTGRERLWDGVEAGELGIRPSPRVDALGLGVRHAGEVADAGLAPASSRAASFAIAAGREALAQAEILPERLRGALVLGMSMPSGPHRLEQVLDAIGDALGLEGPRLVISTACSSSTHAIGVARDLVEGGQCEWALAGGADELTPELLAGFASLGVLADAPCSPFSRAIGTTLGEGAAMVVIERRESAAQRGVAALADVAGYALSSDAFHATSPEPSGAGVARAIRAALDDASTPPGAVDYVNAHGTGTAANDPAETAAIRAVFGAAPHPAVSSSKSFLGHAQGAAGALELLVTLGGMCRGYIPHTASFAGPRPRCLEDPVAADRPRRGAIQRAVSNSSAFGGANASLVLTAPGLAARRREPRRTIYACGPTMVGPSGAALGALRPGTPISGRAPDATVKAVRGLDPRGLDRTTRLLAAAVEQALAAVKAARRVDALERVGLFVGQTRTSPEVNQAFERSIEERGLAKLSATAFSKLVLNAAVGAVTRALGVRGASTALSTGESSGTTIVALAADYLAAHRELDVVIAAGVHELGADEDGAEGAAAIALTTQPPEGASARLDAWWLCARGERPPLDDGDRAVRPCELVAPSGGFSGAAGAAYAVHLAAQSSEPLVVIDDRGTLCAQLDWRRTGS